MKALFLPVVLLSLAACGSATPRMDAASEAMIDCLAAKTVVEISDKVKAGVEAGKTSDQLRPVQAEVTKANMKTLEATYTEQQQKTYFEYQTAKRLNAVQDALANPNGAAEAKQSMDETFALARDCTFGPTR